MSREPLYMRRTLQFLFIPLLLLLLYCPICPCDWHCRAAILSVRRCAFIGCASLAFHSLGGLIDTGRRDCGTNRTSSSPLLSPLLKFLLASNSINNLFAPPPSLSPCGARSVRNTELDGYVYFSPLISLFLLFSHLKKKSSLPRLISL